jgi:hypothetical protein
MCLRTTLRTFSSISILAKNSTPTMGKRIYKIVNPVKHLESQNIRFPEFDTRKSDKKRTFFAESPFAQPSKLITENY